ncbi:MULTISPECIES: TetR/AcrR family transcriptional regulator [Glutamicibacter]|jgi:AcrR family transcriptional regulator|uniref:TetR/AcrR family transcriptional regulator n=1 Tax=Glutamicibacter TaxID=1742989 RepID=UPI00093D4A26|nr:MULTISPECIES: TetR/AcrR family transcriptional regulator [Glutamicibacter]UTM48412.1 TetR/AcrR family transcriptional regulator [Glutamicibacter mysorens]
MTTLTGQRRRVRATDSKEKLFEAAMRLLGSRSPESVSVDEIAAAAGVSKGTVYYNFGSKDELVSQLLSYGAQKLMGELARVASAEDPYLALRQMLEFAMDFVASYPAFAHLWMQEQLDADTANAFAGTPLNTQVTGLIIEVLERLVVLAPEQKLSVATSIFGAALFTARMRASGRTDLDREQTVRAVLLTVDGLRATRPPASN